MVHRPKTTLRDSSLGFPGATFAAGCTVIALSLVGIARSPAVEGIDRASVELTSNGSYRLDVTGSAASWPIAVYTSTRPDHHNSIRPLATIRSAPVTLTVPGRKRVYFHLDPASGSTRVVALRRIPLEGADNFRDLGGYRTASGRYVKWGQVYRSGALNGLTAADYEVLNGLGLRLVCDLRTASERQRAPTRWRGAQGPRVVQAPIVGADPTEVFRAPGLENDANAALRARIALAEAGATARSRSDMMYRRFILEFADSYATVFQRLAHGELPSVTHCSAGQDRTGVFAAVLLTALGVPRETVIEDYLLANHYLRPHEVIERTGREFQQQLGLANPPAMATVRRMLDVHPSMLNLTFEAIDQQWGSFDAFLRTGLKLNSDDLSRLRAHLLQD